MLMLPNLTGASVTLDFPEFHSWILQLTLQGVRLLGIESRFLRGQKSRFKVDKIYFKV